MVEKDVENKNFALDEYKDDGWQAVEGAPGWKFRQRADMFIMDQFEVKAPDGNVKVLEGRDFKRLRDGE